MQKYSRRINYIQEQVSTEAPVVWDLCCDHGQIGMGLERDNRKVYFLDQVNSIIQNIKDTYIPSGAIILADARIYKFPLSKEKTVFIICGIGGELGIEILGNLIPQLRTNDEIVFSPHNGLLKVRKMLSDSKLYSLKEAVIADNNQFYEIFVLSLSGENKTPALPGKYWSMSDDELAYIKHQIDFYTIKARYDETYAAILSHFKSLI